MEHLRPTDFFDLTHFRHRSLFDGCTYVWEALTRIQLYLETAQLGKIDTQVPQGAYLENAGSISIGAGTVIEPGCYIKGPCIIGENCSIRHGAYIRGSVIAGDGCVLGHDSEFKNALLLDHAHAAHFAYVGDTILGNRVNLGAGTVCANLKFDKSEVNVSINGHKIHSGLKKFGAVVGDEAQTGCNSVLNPGTLLGKRARCYPCTHVGGYVPAGHVARQEGKCVHAEK